jgi:hypothetical protein
VDTPETQPFSLDDECLCCHSGPVNLRLCSDGRTVVLVCDECGTTWLRPESAGTGDCIFPSSPDYEIEGSGCSIAAWKGARPATDDEARAAGWGDYL